MKKDSFVTIAVGYGWEKFDAIERSLKDEHSEGYEVLHDKFWKSIKEKFKGKCETIAGRFKQKFPSAGISFKRLRASHGKQVWPSILENLKNADILIFDVVQPPKQAILSDEPKDIANVFKTFNTNVLVEIGVALGLDKRVVLMCPKHLFKDVPSDLKGYLWTTYTGTISKDGFMRTFCDERGIQNAFMGMVREVFNEKLQLTE